MKTTVLPPLGQFPRDLDAAQRTMFRSLVDYEAAQREAHDAEEARLAITDKTPEVEEAARDNFPDAKLTLKALRLLDPAYAEHVEVLRQAQATCRVTERNLSIARRRHDTFTVIAERIQDVRYVVEGSPEHQAILAESNRGGRRDAKRA